MKRFTCFVYQFGLYLWNVKVKLLLIGKTNKSFLSDGEHEYHKRIEHYLKFERIELNDLKQQKNLTTEQIKIAEGKSLLGKIKNDDFIILLDERGLQLTSIDFSKFMANHSLNGQKNVVFVIGGAYGFSEEVYTRANYKLSLSKMTFSHQMVRMIFLEQLYRAMTILKGEPYHHD
jgi:23S rRNA (pseudouridine1915-N3)-methyltransferase